eukprot:gene45439-22497_t
MPPGPEGLSMKFAAGAAAAGVMHACGRGMSALDRAVARYLSSPDVQYIDATKRSEILESCQKAADAWSARPLPDRDPAPAPGQRTKHRQYRAMRAEEPRPVHAEAEGRGNWDYFLRLVSLSKVLQWEGPDR